MVKYVTTMGMNYYLGVLGQGVEVSKPRVV